MSLFNYASKELTLKVVYYGPGLSGKTTNIQYLHRTIHPEKRGKLLSLATETDRTLFFDFLPVDLGKINDFNVRFQLYTVPGQIRYNSTRRLVLRGADAVVFVADSQQEMRQYNKESLESMIENLKANGIDPGSIPVVLQYNKRDLSNIMTAGELDADLNLKNYPVFLAAAVNGEGVDETFKGIIKILMRDLVEKQKLPAAMPAGAAKSSAAKAVEPVYAMEDMIERFGPGQNMAAPAAPIAATSTESQAGAEIKADRPIISPDKIRPGNGDAPAYDVRKPDAADGILSCLEDIQKAIAGLASKLEALGPELKTTLEKSAGQPVDLSFIRTEVQTAAARPGQEVGRRLAEMKEQISGLPQAVSNLLTSNSDTQAERERDKKQAKAQEEFLMLALEIKRLQEESLARLKQLCEQPEKSKKGRFRLFSR